MLLLPIPADFVRSWCVVQYTVPQQKTFKVLIKALGWHLVPGRNVVHPLFLGHPSAC